MTSTTSTTTRTIHTAIKEERGDLMTSNVLDREAPQHQDTGLVTSLATSLGGLHDEVDKVDQAARDRLPCRVNDPELWFAESPADVEFAKALCLDCPVRELCLGGALDRREPWGVWGGELFLQGTVIPRKRPRGRPRKVRPEEAVA